MLAERGWTVLDAPWRGPDVVFDLIAAPAQGKMWAVRLYQHQPEGDACEMLERDLLESPASHAIALMPLQSVFVGSEDGYSERAALELSHLALQAREVAAAL
jgi:hypothetical protein